MKRNIALMTILAAGNMHAAIQPTQDVIVITLCYQRPITISTGVMKKLTLKPNPKGGAGLRDEYGKPAEGSPDTLGIIKLPVGQTMTVTSTSPGMRPTTYKREHMQDNVFTIDDHNTAMTQEFNINPINRKSNKWIFNKYPILSESEYLKYGIWHP